MSMMIPTDPADGDLAFANELGVTHVYTWVPPERSSVAGLTALRQRVEAAGLTLFNVGHGTLAKSDKIHLALPGRDAAIAEFGEFLHHLGAAGIHTTTFTFEPDGVWSTAPAAARGGAPTRAVDAAQLAAQAPRHGRSYTEAEIWDNFAYFMERIIPVAEAAGVRLALHPNDPPVPEIAGVPCIIRSWEAYDRAFQIGDSDNLGMEFCTGCWLEGGVNGFGDVQAAIPDFVARGKVFIVHFRNVSSALPKFHETFVDEGYQNMNVLMRLFHDSGYGGTMILDHTPLMAQVGQADAALFGHFDKVATAYAIGYMKALRAVAADQSGA
jgi:mannonate dehydratase